MNRALIIMPGALPRPSVRGRLPAVQTESSLLHRRIHSALNAPQVDVQSSKTLSWPALQGGVYSAAPDLDEPAHHGLDDDDAVPGADPGTPGSATVRRDMVTISQPPCQRQEDALDQKEVVVPHC